MSIQGRRRGRVEVKPINVIGMENVEATEVAVRDRGEAMGGGLARENVELPVVTLDSVPDTDHTVTVTRTAAQYIEPPKVYLEHPTTNIDENTAPIPTVGGVVINLVSNVDEPIDETVHNLPKVFQRKIDKPLSVK